VRYQVRYAATLRLHNSSPTERAVPTILLVEDNELNRDMLSRRLRKHGFEIAIARDGREAIDAARQTAPDLILMDLSLPEVDGWQATRILKDDPETRAIPIIALTAHAMAGEKERALAAGCNDYDTKPIDLDRLLTRIKRLIGAPG
jgi:CheY-like chemotaxis protein